MIEIGMIYQYDNTQQSGLIMLTNGQTVNFSENDWTDTTTTPSVGQKISYQNIGGMAKVKLASEEDKKPKVQKETRTLKEDINAIDITDEFVNIEECISTLNDLGYKLVKDMQDEQTRVVTLRLYTVEEYGEATIKQIDSRLILNQTLNGKPVRRN